MSRWERYASTLPVPLSLDSDRVIPGRRGIDAIGERHLDRGEEILVGNPKVIRIVDHSDRLLDFGLWWVVNKVFLSPTQWDRPDTRVVISIC